jgi:pimeloyl-ACP methyl ester carboxylesterase
MLRPKRKIIISVHGIWTTGSWQKELASTISERGWIYYPLDYGYFTPIRFAIPFLRRGNIEWFRQQFAQIKSRYPDVTPSVVAHSNGTYIVCEALLKYPEIRIDKLILCGAVVRRSFEWTTVFDRKQVTAVRNEVGQRDIWSRSVRLLAPFDSGPSGQQGFLVRHERLDEPVFSGYAHSSFHSVGHYQEFWLPFLDKAVPYIGDDVPVRQSEELVSPYDAARWSAMTYFHQYVSRVNDAISRAEIFGHDDKLLPSVKALHVIIPRTPSEASKPSVAGIYRKYKLKEGCTGKLQGDRRSIHYNGGELLYDVPTVINTLAFLDKRTDEELTDAVAEFGNCLRQLVHSPRHGCQGTVQVINLHELPSELV